MFDRTDIIKWMKVVAIAAIIIVVTCLGAIMLRQQRMEPIKVTIKNNENEISTKIEAQIKQPVEEKEFVIVDIKGQIVNPGVYRLEKGKRVNDAIELAGGILDKGDISTVNRAAVLRDGQVIYIPLEGEKITTPLLETQSSGKININSASEMELSNLPGIGSTIARDIIQYRNESNGFEDIEEIKNVKGIGEKKFDSIKDLIEVN